MGLINVDGLNQVSATLILQVVDATSDVLVLPPLNVLSDEHLWLINAPER